MDLASVEQTAEDTAASLAALSEVTMEESNTGPLVPPPPENLEDTGLSQAVVEQIILKMLYLRGEVLGREISQSMGLRYSVIDDLMETFKRHQLVQVRRSLGMGNMSSYFSLSESGRHHAQQHLANNQYAGPAPVPLRHYQVMVRGQRQQPGWLTPAALAHAYRRMVVTPQILSQIGPAVSSGNAFLIYGEPGNGKTYLAEALADLDRTPIYMPYALEYQGNIIQIYDPTYHQVIEDEGSLNCFAFEMPYDGRWFKCRRPFIVTGGELTLEMLDLSFNEISRIYDAPFQLKANNGIYLIDDFGRQRVTPAEVLNRWIVPMERRVDYLSLRSGGKLTVPFEAFLVFSTNLDPAQLGDEAFLRRIQYKMRMPKPSVSEYLEIFRKVCDSREVLCDDQVATQFIQRHYRPGARPMRRCHPRDVISHALDIIHFEGSEFVLTGELLDRAWESCFVEDPQPAPSC
jgi:DNA-binding MarR family transcriptional regulator